MMPVIIDTRVPRHTGLNRTFYGIETYDVDPKYFAKKVLIVPFMELKHKGEYITLSRKAGLNRTFYGIDTN